MSFEQQEVERICREIAETLAEVVNEAAGGPKRLGFALLLFDYGSQGTMAFASNTHRAEMIKALRELLGHLQESHT